MFLPGVIGVSRFESSIFNHTTRSLFLSIPRIDISFVLDVTFGSINVCLCIPSIIVTETFSDDNSVHIDTAVTQDDTYTADLCVTITINVCNVIVV